VEIRNVDPGELVARLRVLAAEAGRLPARPDAAGEAGGTSFASLLERSIEQVNALQQRAGNLTTAFERGDPGVSLAEVMVAVEKAGIAFQAATEVRNRLVRAYQDVMNMPL